MKKFIKRSAVLLAACVMFTVCAVSCSSSQNVKEVSSTIELADSYYNSGDIDKAIETIKDALVKNDSDELRNKLEEYEFIMIKQYKYEQTMTEPESSTAPETLDITSSNEALKDFKIDETTLVEYLGYKSNVVIPYGITTIEANAFSESERLKSVTIPDSVTSIETRAFYECHNLTSVTIPDSVTSIGGNAFYGTKWLEQKRDENPLVIVNGLLIDGKKTEGNVVIPDGVTSICGSAFDACDRLKGVTIPDSVTSIGEMAFHHCYKLANITIPDSVTSIGKDAFNGCYYLTSITIPDSVTSIGNRAFGGCEKLTSVSYKGKNYTQGSIDELYALFR